jgi:phosphoribosylglycinamide formyltransferase 2
MTELLAVLPCRLLCGVTAKGIVFDGVADALRVPNSDIRLFCKPESFGKRRMGVALAFDADVEVARVNAKKAAAFVKPSVG